MVTSRAVVDSSQIMILALLARAMAMTIRWRIPPENWKGYCSNRSSGLGIPTISISSIARFFACSFVMCSFKTRASVICFPIFMMGFSAESGSWKIREISFPRIL